MPLAGARRIKEGERSLMSRSVLHFEPQAADSHALAIEWGQGMRKDVPIRYQTMLYD